MIGTGYVGLVTGTCLAEVGNDVLCLDVDALKIETLNGGGVPIHELGLEAMVRRNAAAGRLRFTTDVDAPVAHGTLEFIAVGTPPHEDGSADMQYVLQAARNIGRRMSAWKIIVNKSTVPVGTADRVKSVIAEVAKEFGIAQREFSDDEILKRLLLASVNEACKILEEGKAYRASDIDVMWLHGFGFPRYRGGLMFWADNALGAKAILEQVTEWHQRYGDRWKPSNLLKEIAAGGGNLREAKGAGFAG